MRVAAAMAHRPKTATISLLACCLILARIHHSAHAFSPRMQSYRVQENPTQMQQPSAAAILLNKTPEIPASPAVAMNLPADDIDDGSINASATQTSPPDSAATAATDAAYPKPDHAATLASPDMLNAHAATSSNSGAQAFSSNSQQGAMIWNPDASWDTWGLGSSGQGNLFDMQHPGEPSSFSIQITTTGSTADPAQVHISSVLNGYGLDVDWQQEDAMKVVEAVENQMAKALMPVEDIFNNMLVESTQGLVQSLDALAHGGLLDWQQRLFAGSAMLSGGLRRRLKQSSSGQIDLLRVLVPAGVQ